MQNTFEKDKPKKSRWLGLVAPIIAILIWQYIQQCNRRENEQQRLYSLRYSLENQSINVNIDSIQDALNKEKKSHNILLVDFNKLDSCFILFRDTLNNDTTGISFEFTAMLYKYKLDKAANVTSLLVMPMLSKKQSKDPDFIPKTLYLYAKTGSNIYKSFDSAGAFKH